MPAPAFAFALFIASVSSIDIDLLVAAGRTATTSGSVRLSGLRNAQGHPYTPQVRPEFDSDLTPSRTLGMYTRIRRIRVATCDGCHCSSADSDK